MLREGEVRYTSGTLPTKYTFTGQYSNVSDFGLMYYNSRWVDPYPNPLYRNNRKYYDLLYADHQQD